jgi:hypothetical protein
MSKPVIKNQRSLGILSDLLDSSRSSLLLWSSDDLLAILEHQLSVTLGSQKSQVTFGDALFGDAISDQALLQVKSFAKEALADGGDFPHDVARIIYVSAILRGLASGLVNVTTLSRQDVEREARWCLTLLWLPASFHDLIASNLRTLNES